MTRTCYVSFPSRAGPLPFEYFEASGRHVTSILNGTTYPEVPDVGDVRTILDIGANVGAASVMFAARFPDAEIHAFEPGPAPRAVLERNVTGLGRIRVHPFGLHDHDARTKLYRSRWDPMSASIETSAENGLDFDEIEVRQASTVLDALGIADVDVVKIDTEGCEVPIMICLNGRLARARLIYLEYHSDADRRKIDAFLGPTHVLACGTTRHPHRGDLCYVARATEYARRMTHWAIEPAQRPCAADDVR